jgi:hypothetical protein
MLVAAFVIEKNLRAMGKAGLEQVSANLRTGRRRPSGPTSG